MAATPYQQVIPQIVQPQQYPQILPQPTQQQFQRSNTAPNVGVYWVQGLAGAKGFQSETPNADIYLRDAEDMEIMYIKTTDQFGRPNGLERYRMVKEPINDSSNTDNSNFVTVDQLNDILDSKFEKLVEKLNKPQNNHKGNRNNGSRRNNRRYEEDEDYDETE